MSKRHARHRRPDADDGGPGRRPVGPPPPEAEPPEPPCALCGRPIPPDAPKSLHHLVPKLKGGTHGPTVLLHHICHKEIHATLTEAELARDYSNPERLREHPRLARFVHWVAKRPPHFLSRVPGRGSGRGSGRGPKRGDAARR